MKLKSSVLWLLVVAFLASVGFLFSANRQKEEALVSFRESKQQAADLQAQLDQVKSSNAAAQGIELSRLRADNKDLPLLRNQVTQLQAANRKLTDEFNSTLAALQQQQAQMQRLATENQQARAAVQQVGATVQAAADVVVRDNCIKNLRIIYAAKQEWALENNKTADAVPTAQDIAPYIKLDANGNIPGCPSGGTYTIGAVGVPPSCSIHGDYLP